jgi:hypothetical protein
MTFKHNARLVYSTGTAGTCAVCGFPQRVCQCSTQRAASEPIPARLVAKLRMERKGRKYVVRVIHATMELRG